MTEPDTTATKPPGRGGPATPPAEGEQPFTGIHRYQIPSISSLLAFEATARLGSITRAAEERATSHSAVSRHIRVVEKTFQVALFERRGRGVALTKNGETFFLAIQSGLDTLHNAGQKLRDRQDGLTIGCTLEISALLLHPIFPRLKRALGDAVAARIVVYDYDLLPLLVPSGLDIVFEAADGAHPDPRAVPVLREEIVPVASPAFAERFGALLAGHPRTWRHVPRLNVGRQSPGWASWDTWFEAHGCAAPEAPVETFENYFNLLPAAANGDGLAIGWNGFMSEYFETGRLVAVRDGWLATGLRMYAITTPNSGSKSASRTCLEELPRLIGGLCIPSPVTARADPSPMPPPPQA